MERCAPSSASINRPRPSDRVLNSTRSDRATDALRSLRRRLATLPLAGRVAGLALVVAVAFAAVVLPLFSGGGTPRAEISGFLPASVSAGRQVRVDIGVDNTGDSIISPLCVAMSGDGATLASADFQGLETIPAAGNRVCGGQLTAQETISLTLVFTIQRRGSFNVRLVPEQGRTVIGPAFVTSVTAT